MQHADSVYPGEPTCGDGFDITFDAGYLAGKKQSRICARLQRFVQYLWRVDKGITVDLAVLKDFGVFETRDQPHNPSLLRITEVILKSDQSIGVGHEVLLSELDAGVWLVVCARIVQT